MFHLAESGFGNWLYIVFGIIYFLYQIFSAGKKKNKNLPPQTDNSEDDFELPDSTPSKNPLEELFDKLKDLEKQKNPANEPERVLVHTVQQTEVKPVKRETPLKKKSMKRSAPLEVIEIEDVEKTGFMMGIDIRDAIIASEILKRPE